MESLTETRNIRSCGRGPVILNIPGTAAIFTPTMIILTFGRGPAILNIQEHGQSLCPGIFKIPGTRETLTETNTNLTCGRGPGILKIPGARGILTETKETLTFGRGPVILKIPGTSEALTETTEIFTCGKASANFKIPGTRGHSYVLDFSRFQEHLKSLQKHTGSLPLEGVLNSVQQCRTSLHVVVLESSIFQEPGGSLRLGILNIPGTIEIRTDTTEILTCGKASEIFKLPGGSEHSYVL
jgi:hypothetical protein